MTSSKQSINKVARSTTPPEVKSMGIREFMRGGVYDLKEPTVIMSHSDVMGTWVPRGQGVTANYASVLSATASSLPMASSTSSFSSGNTALTAESISQAVESAVLKATQRLEDSTTQTITRLMNERKGDTSGG
jgi:hypothetical protein